MSADHVLVWFQATPHGRAAIVHAQELASASGARLTVVAVAMRERVDVGCARCRQGAAIWNREMTDIGHEELQEAAGLLGGAGAAGYVLAFGSPAQAIVDTAIRCGADVIVLPSGRQGPLLERRSGRLKRQLSQRGVWCVVTAPPASASGSRVGPRHANR